MPKLVDVKGFRDDISVIYEEDAVPTSATEVPANAILPMLSYVAFVAEQTGPSLPDTVGVWLSSGDDIHALAPYAHSLTLIACRFSNFMDGRGFSQARLLREKYEYKGELRASGQFIQDQAHYLCRCGFNTFSVEDDINVESFQTSLSEFTESYQAACDTSLPLFRRRA